MENQDVVLLNADFMIKSILYAFGLQNLDSVHHFLSDDCYETLNEKIKLMEDRKEQYVFEDLDTKCMLNREFDTVDGHCIEVLCTCKGIYYLLSPLQIITEEEKTKRRSFNVKVLLEKKNDAKRKDYAICSGCGKSFDIKIHSTCPQCGRIYDLANFDYIIKEIDI